MRVRENLSSIVSSFGMSNQNNLPTPEKRIGKVYGVVTGIDTPTPLQFQRAGGVNALGTVFCLDFDKSKNITGSFNDDFLNTCTPVRPLNSNINFYPLVGELVDIIDSPGPLSLVTINGDNKYYSSVVSIWNNIQHNALVNQTGSLGLSFTESPNIRPLLNFEGDIVVQGRKGNSIRFGTTSPFYSDINEWSSIGKNGDPITILSNGHNFSGSYHIEKINEEASSIYLTTTQQLPLIPDRLVNLNPFTNPTLPFLYNNAQVIMNGDRIVLNSKKDEVMIFGKTNIEISTNNVINLNANDRVHINGNKVFLGTIAPQNENETYELPTEPVLLGNQTVTVLKDLIMALHSFAACYHSSITPPPGVPIDTCGGGQALMKDLQDITSNLSNLLSQITYTA